MYTSQSFWKLSSTQVLIFLITIEYTSHNLSGNSSIEVIMTKSQWFIDRNGIFVNVRLSLRKVLDWSQRQK